MVDVGREGSQSTISHRVHPLNRSTSARHPCSCPCDRNCESAVHLYRRKPLVCAWVFPSEKLRRGSPGRLGARVQTGCPKHGPSAPASTQILFWGVGIWKRPPQMWFLARSKATHHRSRLADQEFWGTIFGVCRFSSGLVVARLTLSLTSSLRVKRNVA